MVVAEAGADYVMFGEPDAAGRRERLQFVERGGKSDAGDFEQFRPPRHTLGDGVEGGPAAGGVRLAEHDVVGASFGGEHGVVPGRESAAAGDARGLERRHRRHECVDAAQMRTVGAGAHREIGISVEEECRALTLHRWRERLGVIDLRALIGLRQAQQHGGNVGGVERLRESVREPGRVLRGHEIKARDGAARISQFFSGRHGHRLPPQSGSLGAFIKPQPYETVKARTLRRSRHSCVAAPGSGPKRAEGSDRRPFGYAAFFSRSCFHCPRVARLFIMARWMKARWAAATFSLLPDQAFCGAACSARP